MADDSGLSDIKEVTPSGVQSTFATLPYNSDPIGLAFDSSGNLYSANYNSGTISKITPGGSVSQHASGLTNPQYLAFSPATPAPEPSTWALLGAASAVFFAKRLRAGKRKVAIAG